jgi:hypothetical protein
MAAHIFNGGEGKGLRFSDTNSASDSKGSVWGMEGSSFWFLLGGAVLAVSLMLTLFTSYGVSFVASAAVAAGPLFLTVVYVFGFKNGKPPSYDVDVFEQLVVGRHWAPDHKRQPTHPLRETDGAGK